MNMKTSIVLLCQLMLLSCMNSTPSNQLTENKNSVTMRTVNFKSEGLTLAGNLFLPQDFDQNKTYPAIVIAGSWTTVKEQMAGLYAEKLAQNGFITLAFDFRNYGASEGEPRFYESPQLKIQDINNAVSYLQSLSEVNDDKVGAFGVCAGAGYILDAAANNSSIKAVTTAASWIHDAEATKLFYGGEEGVQAKINAAQEAKKRFAETGEATYIPAISTTDESAAMFGEYDYYLNPERGAIPQWSNDKFAVMSWEDWLTYSPMPNAKHLTTPTLMIHSDGSVLPDYTKAYFEQIATDNKKLHWISSGAASPFEQFDFYDQAEKVDLSVELATDWFNKQLAN
ncbi:MAG: alpha/beta hydrolase [Flammeovirgaceae bacterium]